MYPQFGLSHSTFRQTMPQPPEQIYVSPNPDTASPASNNPAQKTPSDNWWQTRLKEHPFKAVSLTVLTIGGLSLLMFFAHLGVMPDLDFAGASATMAAVAMIGLLVTVALGGSTLAPGLTTRNLITSQPYMFQSRWMIAVFAIPAIAAFLAFATLDARDKNWSAAALSCLAMWVLVLMALLLLASTVALWRLGAFKPPAESSSTKLMRAIEIMMGLLGGGFIWLLMPLLALLSFAALWPEGRAPSDFGSYLATWGLFCVAMNVVLAYLPKEHELGGIAFIGLGSVFLLLALTQNWPGIPVAAVRALGLGEVPVALVLTEQGCHTLNKASRGQVVCQLDAETKVGWACPVVLKSRIGSPFVVEVTSFDTDGKWPAQLPITRGAMEQPPAQHALRYQRIQLTKTDVLSWPTIALLKNPGESFYFNAEQLTSVWHQDRKAMSSRQIDWLHAQCGDSRTTVAPEGVPDTQIDHAGTGAKVSTLPADRKGT